jgi:quercetin dioxygenase-like cupin family protein
MIIPNIDRIKYPKEYCYLGNIPLYGDDLFKTVDDAIDYYYSRDKEYNRFIPKSKLLMARSMEKDSNTPVIIKDVYNELNKHIKMYCTVGLISSSEGNEKNGIGWHRDREHVMGMNIIGNTTWVFRDGNEIKMGPGDLIYVPKGIEHKVYANEERFTIGFIWQ